MLSNHIFLGLPHLLFPSTVSTVFDVVQSHLSRPSSSSLPFYCVQSLMLSSHIFLGLPRLLFPSTVPCNNSLEMPLCLEMCSYQIASLFFTALVVAKVWSATHYLLALCSLYEFFMIRRRHLVSNACSLCVCIQIPASTPAGHNASPKLLNCLVFVSVEALLIFHISFILCTLNQTGNGILYLGTSVTR